MRKRGLDLVLVLISAPLWGPLLVGVALLVRRRIGSPVLFRQERPGLAGRIYRMSKFRSMTEERGSDGLLLPDAQRLRPFGRWLRSTSLDELPELLNVLSGRMSLVGPRPLLTRYLERYSPEQRRRHDLPPGITGWAQVSGRNALTWDEKFACDVWYVENASLGLDLWILARTVWTVIRRDGISAAGEATMPEFMGRVES
jgi:sugar transferase EpsL